MATTVIATEVGEPEIERLRRLAWIVFAALAAASVAAITALIALLPKDASAGDQRRLLVVAVLAATAGSAISALHSATDRYGHGLELADGTKVPTHGRADRFGARLVPLFLMRPLMGSLMGLVVYAGLSGGYLIATSGNTKLSPAGVVFFAALAGLFAKTALERLKIVFGALLGDDGAKKALAGQD